MEKISKRRFLRMCMAGSAAMLAGWDPVRLMAKSLSGPAPPASTPPAGPGKFSKETPYSIVTPKGIRCQICPNACTLKEGAESTCRTKTVWNGKLYSIAYGNPCSVHSDPVEKKPLYHFLPNTTTFSLATAGCNFACLNCQNWEISQQSPKDTGNTEMFPAPVVEEALRNKARSVAYTYSEPVAFYEYMYDTARLARSKGLKNVLVSNGYINEKPLRDLCKYLDAANINLKSFSEEIYARLNSGSLRPVLNTLKILREEGVWLEITNLVIPGWTDDLGMIKEMCDWLVLNGFAGYPLHFIRFFPMYKLTNLPYTPVDVLEKARDIALKTGLHYVYIGNVPNTAAEHTYCPKCKKIVVERRGFTTRAVNLNHGNCKFCNTRISGVWE